MFIVLIFAFVVFNFRTVFGIGIFNAEDDFTNSYSDGTAGVNLHMRLEHFEEKRYYLYTFIDLVSTGNVANYGVLSISIFYENEGGYVYATTIDFGTPLSNPTMDRIHLIISKYNNITCYGTIELYVETGGVPMNDTINFQLSYIVPWGVEDYHNTDLMLYSLFFVPFFLPIIIPIVLNWIYRPKFGFNYSEEEEKRDELYLKYLHEHIKEQREKAIK